MNWNIILLFSAPLNQYQGTILLLSTYFLYKMLIIHKQKQISSANLTEVHKSFIVQN